LSRPKLEVCFIFIFLCSSVSEKKTHVFSFNDFGAEHDCLQCFHRFEDSKNFWKAICTLNLKGSRDWNGGYGVQGACRTLGFNPRGSDVWGGSCGREKKSGAAAFAGGNMKKS